jgi:hypothetical protein
MRILMISLHSIEMNLKFKSAQEELDEQATLQEIFKVMMEEVRPIIANSKEEYPDAYEMVTTGIKNKIKVEAHAYDYHLFGEVFVQNLDRFLLEDPAVMKGVEAEDD